jgi:hypothetical protein
VSNYPAAAAQFLDLGVELVDERGQLQKRSPVVPPASWDYREK